MATKSSHVGDVLAEVFKRGGMKRAVRRAEAVLLWPQVVGREVAKFTEAKTLQDGVLIVEVADSETSMHLTLQRQRFVDVYRGKFGSKDVRDIRFRLGRPAVPPPEPPPPKPVPVDSKALAKLAKDLDLPQDLARPAIGAAKAMLSYRARKRAEGWRDCEVCGALDETHPLCTVCQRYALRVQISRASRVLAANPAAPTPLLSEDERAVAVYLAKRYLMDKLQELLPQVLADPAFRSELEFVARCYVAHELKKPLEKVEPQDLDLLENRVARALGRWR